MVGTRDDVVANAGTRFASRMYENVVGMGEEQLLCHELLWGVVREDPRNQG